METISNFKTLQERCRELPYTPHHTHTPPPRETHSGFMRMFSVARGASQHQGLYAPFSSLRSPSARNYSCLSLTLMTLKLLKLLGQPFCRLPLHVALSAVCDPAPRVMCWGQRLTEVMPRCLVPSCWPHSVSIVLILAEVAQATYRCASFLCRAVAFSPFTMSI